MIYKKLYIALLIFICLGLNGCYSWFNPPIKFVESEMPSYDNGELNSGIVDIDYDNQGYIVTKNFVNRYNNLVDLNRYKYKYYTNLHKNDGITKLTSNLYFIDKQHFTYFLLLSDFKKQNKK